MSTATVRPVSTASCVTMTVDRSQLRLFAKATGQTDPVYWDVDAARAAGHPDLLVPPTFLFGVELHQPDPFWWIKDLGYAMTAVLHGSQFFEYLLPVHAGDEVTATGQVVDTTVKKGGALTLITRRTTITRDAVTVARLTAVTVIREEVA
jgi:acyl dehydratase